jgi:hypothetical protein
MVLTGEQTADRHMLQERFDRIPVFEPRVQQGNSGNEVLSAVTTWQILTTWGSLYIQKQEDWTDLEIYMSCSAFRSGGGPGNVAIGAMVDNQIIPAPAMSLYFETTGLIIKPIAGFTRTGGPSFPVKAGRRRIQFLWFQSIAGPMNMNSANYFSCRVCECLPFSY